MAYTLIPREDVWIGYNDRSSHSNWVWTSTGQGGEYTNWAEGEPFGNGDCALIWQKKKPEWDNQNCGRRRLFICEKGKCKEFCLSLKLLWLLLLLFLLLLLLLLLLLQILAPIKRTHSQTPARLDLSLTWYFDLFRRSLIFISQIKGAWRNHCYPAPSS